MTTNKNHQNIHCAAPRKMKCPPPPEVSSLVSDDFAEEDSRIEPGPAHVKTQAEIHVYNVCLLEHFLDCDVFEVVVEFSRAFPIESAKATI